MSEVKDEATQDNYAFPYIRAIYVPIVIAIQPTLLCLKTRKNNISASHSANVTLSENKKKQQ
jgi:hypothetical protein